MANAVCETDLYAPITQFLQAQGYANLTISKA